MAADNAALKQFDNLEESLPPVPAGGGFWFGSSGFWGEEDYRGFVDGYKADNLINVSQSVGACRERGKGCLLL